MDVLNCGPASVATVLDVATLNTLSRHHWLRTVAWLLLCLCALLPFEVPAQTPPPEGIGARIESFGEKLARHDLPFMVKDLLQDGWIIDPSRALRQAQRAQLAAIAGLLVVLLAFALRGRARRRGTAASVIAGVVLVGAAVAAVGAVGARHLLLKGIGAERLTVLRAIEARPEGPWPRSRGHVPLGIIGAEAVDKAYIEPGGSGSPWVGSFGVSLWLDDGHGNLVATSDDVPLGETDHRYVTGATGESGLEASAPAWLARWQIESNSSRTLTITPRVAAGQRLLLSLRGVGPAAGPTRSIEIADGVIRVNGRWELRADAPLPLVASGIEGHDRWRHSAAPTDAATDAAAAPVSIEDAKGWAQARFELPTDRTITIRIADPRRTSERSAPMQTVPLVLEGFDAGFTKAIRSQIETLKQGIVGEEIRPGEPLNYPLAWLRDNAFEIVALARSGEPGLARLLSRKMAEEDFFGGFGTEGDNPGLALWTLHEVSMLLDDEAFDASLWPHVVRKVAFIEASLAARETLHHPFVGPLVPDHADRTDLTIIAGPSRHGLVYGRMDLEFPVFYTSATSYSGLRAAADYARRLGHPAEATRWGAAADALRIAWRAAFEARIPDWDNERSSIFALWPSEIGTEAPVAALLDLRWKAERTADGAFIRKPGSPYFTAADAHQWLRAGRADRAWITLEQLLANETTPGLATLWEGESEENTFRQWRHIRGWVKPPHVSPHYWSGSELLLLQLGMLAELHGEGQGERLVIGAGVLQRWLSNPLRAEGIGTRIGRVDWSWDGRAVAVVVPARAAAVRVELGPEFPPGTSVTVRTRP